MNKSEVKNFYNSKNWIKSQLKDYIYGNLRIERCIALFEKYISKNESYRICDIGCSVGIIPHLLVSKFENIEIDAFDISEDQINVAHKVFTNDKINFSVIDLSKEKLTRRYNIFTFFDVLEHLPPESYKAVFTNIANSILPEGKIILTVPSSYYNNFLHQEHPEKLQIIDEIITPEVIQHIADLVGGIIIEHSLISVWRKFDYAHYVISIEEPLGIVEYNKKSSSLVEKIIRRLGISPRNRKIKKRQQEVDNSLRGSGLL